jgi:SAM-dependent methyltransferase
LSLGAAQRTSAVVPELFDMDLRALRRDRAARTGVDLFLLDRAFEECLARLALVRRRFDRALLVGCPAAAWPQRLAALAVEVDARDPGPLFASSLGAQPIVEDAWAPEQGAYDLVLAVGTLDSVNDLPLALHLIGHAMRPGGFFIGALSGGDTLPQLRAAMRAADSITGAAAPHLHPRIEASALASLLAEIGFINPVVDVDRVPVSYASFERLVQDLRAMAATNILKQRPRFIGKEAYAAARRNFAASSNGDRSVETFEILHFAAWKQKKG